MVRAVAPMFVGGRRIEYVEVDYPAPGPGQLLLRARANALCGSDQGPFDRGQSCAPGHEVAGEVAFVGEGTTTPVGARGVVYLMVFCGNCRNCRAGRTNLCLDKHGDVGFNQHGGLGPYVLVEERAFHPVDDDVPFALATLLLDVLGTSGHALDRAEKILPDVSSVHVAGAGPVGIGVLTSARARWGDDVEVHVSDVSEFRLRMVEDLGGKPVHADDVGSLPTVDLAVDASGRTSARQAALAGLGRPGVLVCVGHGQELHLDVSADLISAERSVLGSEYFPVTDLDRNLEVLRENRSAVEKVLTHTFDVADLSEAFDVFTSGRSGKVVVTQ